MVAKTGTMTMRRLLMRHAKKKGLDWHIQDLRRSNHSRQLTLKEQV